MKGASLWTIEQYETGIFSVGPGTAGGGAWANAPGQTLGSRYKRAVDGDDDDQTTDDAKSQEDDEPLDNAATTQDDNSDVRQILKKSDGGKKGDVIIHGAHLN